MRNHLGLSAVALGAIVATPVSAQPASIPPPAKVKHEFQGYWTGVDPVDGGDSRRSLVQREDGRFALAARDSARRGFTYAARVLT